MNIVKQFTCYKQHSVTLVDNDGILEVHKKLKTQNKYEKEKHFYSALSDWKHTPSLLGFDDNTLTVRLEYVGEALTQFKPPLRKVYRERITHMVAELESEFKIFHNDIRWKNIVLSTDGALYLVDWERARYENIERDPEKILI